MHFVGNLGSYHVLFAVITLRVPDRAVLFFDPFQNVRQLWSPTAVREDGVGQCELGQSNFTAPEKCRRIRSQRRFDSGFAAEIDHALDSRIHPEPNGGAIFRFRECLARGDRPFVAILRGFRSPFAENSSRPADHDCAIIERGILHHGAGEHSFLECGGENKWRHRGSRRPARLQCAIVLVVLEIAAAHQRKHAASRVVQHDHCPLQIIGCRRWTCSGPRLAKIRGVFSVSLMLGNLDVFLPDRDGIAVIPRPLFANRNRWWCECGNPSFIARSHPTASITFCRM